MKIKICLILDEILKSTKAVVGGEKKEAKMPSLKWLEHG